MNDGTGGGLSVVLGAGPVGRSLVERLLKDNRDVRVVTRSGVAKVSTGVEVVAGDIGDPDSAAGAPVPASSTAAWVSTTRTGRPFGHR